MQTLDIVLLLVASAMPLALLARRLAVPDAVTLVVGGMALAFVPSLPPVTVEPDFVLALFLPPLLHQAAFFMPWRAFRANLVPILLLAIGLVLCTTLLVGLAARALMPWLPWAVCFALGAIVSPPDAVAAASLLERLRLPPRLVTILEGESLVNDASGLILYKFAIAAALTGGFSIEEAAGAFAAVSVIGVGIGAACGLGAARLARRLPETMLVITVTFLAAYGSYLVAERLGGSGVLATVACGLVLGWRAPKDLSPVARAAGKAAWDVVVFVMTTVLFLVLGMSLDEIVQRMTRQSLPGMIGIGLAISAVAIAVRFLWFFLAGAIVRLTGQWGHRRAAAAPWRVQVIMSWAGMRGVVSLAAALAIPLALPDGTPFPGRDLVQALTFVVILVTLVGQATTLGPLIRTLGVMLPADAPDPHAEARARITDVALEHLRARAADPDEGAIAQGFLPEFEAQAASVRDAGEAAARLSVYLEAKRAQHRALIRLHRDGAIGDETLHHLQGELDFDELRMRRALRHATPR